MENHDLIKIIIIGDYLIFRNGLKRLLETNPQFKVVGEMSGLTEAIQEVSKRKVDVIIINSTELADSDFNTSLTNHFHDIPILVLTHSIDIQTHQKYLLLGASGVVTKEQTPETLFKAIRQVHLNDLWFDRRIILQTIAKLLGEMKDIPQKLHSQKYVSLTNREWEVLHGVCKGMKNKALAESLFITETTVRHHLTSIFEKLNVKNRLALAILAYNDGVVEIADKNKSPV